MNSTVTLTFTIEQINVILRHLDAGAHAQVRQLIDIIITETNAQQQAESLAKQNAEAAPKDEVLQ